jgi:hypothetical protein
MKIEKKEECAENFEMKRSQIDHDNPQDPIVRGFVYPCAARKQYDESNGEHKNREKRDKIHHSAN